MPAQADGARTDGGQVPYTFSIVGVQKAGTSTLSALLSTHPEVTAPVKKELHYFDHGGVEWTSPDHSGYAAARREATERVAGDNSPSYLFHPHALERMRAYDPGMRLVALFRDPIERLFSQWAMLRERSDWFPDWPAFITDFRPRRIPRRIPPGAQRTPRRYIARSGVARGLYAQQLERGLALFPREQWLLLDFRAMLADHRAALDAAAGHIGVHPFADHPALLHRKSGPESVHGTAPTEADVAGLAEHYREDLARFAGLSGIDVSAWPTARILAGTVSPAELAGRLAAKVTEPGAEDTVSPGK